ncbi:hypothetical protein [Mycetocola spongiae]|uniref:hypothetical protein n=1 Tax=Mycetocola spongiae TaxID=2859226 RepID=UPI001CF22069|nr:hypothetical protein [Mycetocola spongiae]UCR88553.1 hypothetical protein KXZ72_11380 [Mycetocola spongiae]
MTDPNTPPYPRPVAPAPAPRRGRGLRFLIGFIASIGVLGIMIVGFIAVANNGINLGGGDAEIPETAEPSVAPVPDRPAPAAPGAPAPLGSPDTRPNPQNCAALYSPAYFEKLHRFGPLNDPGLEGSVGSADATLSAELAANPGLRCTWGSVGASALTTNLTRVDAAAQRATIARLTTIGAKCTRENAGTRCLLSRDTAEGARGESHFLREGIWLATAWEKTAPTGYTADIVETLFPG